MEISLTQEQGRVPVTVLHLDGQLNMGASPALEKQARSAFQAGARFLLIDLSQVTSLTSAGLRSILMICRMYSQAYPELNQAESPSNEPKNACVKLLNPNPQVENVLNIAGFDRFLDIFKDRKAAIDSF